MRRREATVALMIVLGSAGSGRAQELAPRAYTVAPMGANYLTFSNAFNTGAVFTDPAAPVQDAKAQFNVQTISIYHSFSLFGRTASITVLVPYVIGQFAGTVEGIRTQASRSGMVDSRVRFAINLKGAAAITPRQFSGWKEDRLLGVSVIVVAPTGQYDPARLINPGYDRWAFKPEIGYSRHLSNWALDLYGGAWLYTANEASYPGTYIETQSAVYVAEAHLSYSVTPRLWISADGNFWAGGRSSVNGENPSRFQRNSRVGATVSIPLTRHWSAKASFSSGVYIPLGGDFNQVTVGLQYGWIGTKWN